MLNHITDAVDARHCRNKTCTRLMPGGTSKGKSFVKVPHMVSAKPALYDSFAVDAGTPVYPACELLGTSFIGFLGCLRMFSHLLLMK